MKTFAIHENLLVKHSDHFKAAASGSWSESESRRVEFEDWSPDVFAIFDHFLYSGKIFSARDNDYNKDPYTDKEWGRLGSAWRLGDMLLSTSFKDAVVDAMVTKLNYGIPRHLHLVFYTGGNSQSMARKLAVDVIVWKCPAGYFNKEHFGDASEEFRWDLLSRLGKVKDTGK